MCRALLGHLWFFAFFAHIDFAGGDHYLCQHRTVMVCLLYLYLNTVHYQSRLPALKVIYCPETPKVPGSLLIMWTYVHWFVSVTESTPSSSQQIFNIKYSNVVLFVWSQPNLNSEYTVTEIVQASIQKFCQTVANCTGWVPGEILKIAPSVIFTSIIIFF